MITCHCILYVNIGLLCVTVTMCIIFLTQVLNARQDTPLQYCERMVWLADQCIQIFCYFGHLTLSKSWPSDSSFIPCKHLSEATWDFLFYKRNIWLIHHSFPSKMSLGLKHFVTVLETASPCMDCHYASLFSGMAIKLNYAALPSHLYYHPVHEIYNFTPVMHGIWIERSELRSGKGCSQDSDIETDRNGSGWREDILTVSVYSYACLSDCHPNQMCPIISLAATTWWHIQIHILIMNAQPNICLAYSE